ncbi:histidine kinase [Candidatus Thiothrix sp. Deng01]|uniref:Histidine kinase n=1 Tax=Candidatus Thiothrix phosphatis TaxID=3112415 RepID=A0ABU6CWW9_9GAMM|nr:histidine kinase [Candidatus Thiothrix sp. Deng01]MEB4591066.1 histidine kinase [Candidatus Thiothrix sp. Deng01]
MSSSIGKTLSYLPNICVPQALLRAVLGAELLAVVLALAVATDLRDFFVNLGMHSLFVQWVALASVFTLCFVARFFVRPTVFQASAIVLVTVAGFTLLASVLGMLASFGNDKLANIMTSALFIFKNLVIALVIVLVLLRYFYIHNQWEESVEADSAAKYDALQARMRPHFLFNSLNTIAHLVHIDPNKAEAALLDLADIMRLTLDKRSRISLKEELDLTLAYLRMEGLRLGEKRLHIKLDMDQNSLPLDMDMPPFLLQPLVENAVYHGIQPRQDGGLLTISLYDAGKTLDVSVTNPLPPTGVSTHTKGNHIAQENMVNRLRLAYGDRANLRIQKNIQQYRVSFSIPKE